MIIQQLGLFDTKKAREAVRTDMRVPAVRLNPSAVAIVHVVSSSLESKVLQYDNLVFAQPPEVGLKLQDDLLVAAPFSAHPFGAPKSVELSLDKTARFEWRRLLKLNIMSHKVVKVAFVSDLTNRDIFLRKPDHLILLDLS
ncbi:hypothetical protein [Deinococcus aquaedulcis]|uniref:hypothetical protein n=1 Tax=Deinococcus aquaedulcis TaxID=2840455 RepID=UPI001C8320A7|nr:hypothetical protein [Deinococcus aquaedulcis]